MEAATVLALWRARESGSVVDYRNVLPVTSEPTWRRHLPARLDKLKHVPQCAARKLTAVSSQRLAFESAP